jgi:hypothetical protein
VSQAHRQVPLAQLLPVQSETFPKYAELTKDNNYSDLRQHRSGRVDVTKPGLKFTSNPR